MSNEIILAKNTSLPAGCHNILVVGTCASGKTYNYVYPNLLQCSGSYVVVDEGCDLKGKTEDMFNAKGYHVLTVNLRADPSATISLEALKSIGLQPTILYIIPSIRDSAANETLIPYIINTIYNEVATLAQIPIHIFADEFPAYGKVMGTLYKQMAERHPKVSCTIVLQSFPQLQWMFGEKWILFVGVCDSLLFLASPVDVDTNRIVMQLLGITPTGKERLFLRLMRPACGVMIAGEEPAFDEMYEPSEHPNFQNG